MSTKISISNNQNEKTWPCNTTGQIFLFIEIKIGIIILTLHFINFLISLYVRYP